MIKAKLRIKGRIETVWCENLAELFRKFPGCTIETHYKVKV
jgi:hypothetical protein